MESVVSYLPSVVAEVEILLASTRCPGGLEWSVDGRLAVGTSRGVCVLTPSRSGGDLALHQAWVRREHPIRSVAWSPPGIAWDGRSLLAALCATTGHLAVYEPPRATHHFSWNECCVVSEGAEPLGGREGVDWRAVCFDGDDRCTALAWCGELTGDTAGLAVGHANGSVVLRELSSQGQKELRRLPAGEARPTAIDWRRPGFVIVGDARGSVVVWDLQGAAPARRFVCRAEDGRSITCLRTSPASFTIAVTAAGALETFTVDDAMIFSSGETSKKTITDLRFDGEGELVLCSELGGCDVEGGEQVKRRKRFEKKACSSSPMRDELALAMALSSPTGMAVAVLYMVPPTANRGTEGHLSVRIYARKAASLLVDMEPVATTDCPFRNEWLWLRHYGALAARFAESDPRRSACVALTEGLALRVEATRRSDPVAACVLLGATEGAFAVRAQRLRESLAGESPLVRRFLGDYIVAPTQPEECGVCGAAVPPPRQADDRPLAAVCANGHGLIRCAKTLKLILPDQERWVCVSCSSSWVDVAGEGRSLCPLCRVHSALAS